MCVRNETLKCLFCIFCVEFFFFSADIDLFVGIIITDTSVTVKAGIISVTFGGKEVKSIYLKCFPNRVCGVFFFFFSE